MYSIDIEMVIMFSVSKTLDPEIKGALTHVSVLSFFSYKMNSISGGQCLIPGTRMSLLPQTEKAGPRRAEDSKVR